MRATISDDPRRCGSWRAAGPEIHVDELSARARFAAGPALSLVASAVGLVAILWPDDRPDRVPLARVTPDGGENRSSARRGHDQLMAYLAGGLRGLRRRRSICVARRSSGRSGPRSPRSPTARPAATAPSRFHRSSHGVARGRCRGRAQPALAHRALPPRRRHQRRPHRLRRRPRNQAPTARTGRARPGACCEAPAPPPAQPALAT